MGRFYPNHFKDFDPETVEVQVKLWFRALTDYTLTEALTALEIWANEQKFPPTLAEFKPVIAKLRNPEVFMSAERAWESVLKAISRFGNPNEARAMEILNEPTKRAIRAVGGWQKICSTPYGRDWDFMRKNFMESYGDFNLDEQEQFLLPTNILKQLQERQKQLGQPNE